MTGIDRIIENALAEDIHTGDITTLAVVRKSGEARAILKAKEEMVLAGIEVAARVFHLLDAAIVGVVGIARHIPDRIGRR